MSALRYIRRAGALLDLRKNIFLYPLRDDDVLLLCVAFETFHRHTFMATQFFPQLFFKQRFSHDT